MPKTLLTDAGLRSLQPPDKGTVDWWDTSLSSFGCRVSQGGAKTFILKLHNSRRAIGRWPVITLSAARTEARKLLAEKTLGKVRPQSINYPTAVELFLTEKRQSRRERTAKDYEWLLDHITFPGQLSELTHQELQRRLKRITAQGTYNHLLVALKVFFNWGIKRRYIEHNPTLGLSTHRRPKRSRVLTDAELQLIWRACEQTGELRDTVATAFAGATGSPPRLPVHFATIVKLLILTGQRRGEIAALKGSYYSHNQQSICLPSELTKNGREHTFPVGSLAASLLCLVSGSSSSQHSFIFPARGNSSSPFSGWSKSKVALDKLSGVTGWTLHDIRRTVRTNLGKLGVAPYIAERLVNHISAQTDMEATYDHWTYLPEMRKAMETYESWLSSLLAQRL